MEKSRARLQRGELHRKGPRSPARYPGSILKSVQNLVNNGKRSSSVGRSAGHRPKRKTKPSRDKSGETDTEQTAVRTA